MIGSKMEEIRKQFAVNERNRKVSEEDESFDIQSAKMYYKKLLEKE
jgi:hypothetical protein